MMKKVLVMLLGLTLTFSVVGCGSDQSVSTNTADAQVQEQEAVETEAKETAAEAAEVKETEAVETEVEETLAEEETQAAPVELTFEKKLKDVQYEITATCPAGSIYIAEAPEIPEEGSEEEISPEDQEILDILAKVEPLYVKTPMIVNDEFICTIATDSYDYPYHSTNMQEFYDALSENSSDSLEMIDINGREAIYQDRLTSIVLRIASDNPDRYFKLEILPNVPDLAVELNGNLADQKFYDAANAVFDSDAFKTFYQSITLTAK